MSDFPTCFSFVLPNEEYTPPRYQPIPDPTQHDPGAQALAGINSAFWPDDFARIVALPQNERGPAVAGFYQANFWNRWLQQLTYNRIAAMALDASINQGAGWAVRFLQSASGSTVDGAWGPNTVAAVNATPLEIVVPEFIAAREARYRQIGGPSLPQWLARAAKIPAFL